MVVGLLLDKVCVDVDLSFWLVWVKLVEILEQVFVQCGVLDDGESLISCDGYWVGWYFLWVWCSDEVQGGMFVCVQELEVLQEWWEVLEICVVEGEECLVVVCDEQCELEGVWEQVWCQVQEEGCWYGELKVQLFVQQVKVE